VHLHEAQAAFRSILHTTCSCSHPPGWQGQQNCLCVLLDVRKAYDTVWRDGLSKLLEKGVDGKRLPDLLNPPQVRVNGDLSEAFP
jgi:hypothetical protein